MRKLLINLFFILLFCFPLNSAFAYSINVTNIWTDGSNYYLQFSGDVWHCWVRDPNGTSIPGDNMDNNVLYGNTCVIDKSQADLNLVANGDFNVFARDANATVVDVESFTPTGGHITTNTQVPDGWVYPTPTAVPTPTPTNTAPVISSINTITSPMRANLPGAAFGHFTDAEVLDTHTAAWDWGDGTTSIGAVTETNGSGTVGNGHTYTSTGSYTLTLTVTDNSGLSDIYQYLVTVIPQSSVSYMWTNGTNYYLQFSRNDIWHCWVQDPNSTSVPGDNMDNNVLYGNTCIIDKSQADHSLVANGNYKIVARNANAEVIDLEFFVPTNGYITTNTQPPAGWVYPIPPNTSPIITSITAPTTTVAVNNSVTLNGSFTDQNATDTHTAVWNWGDGTTSSGIVTESNGSGTVTANHVYTTSGVYTVNLTVTDSANTTTAQDYQYITIYDPNNGWATGEKQYTSPQGAVINNPSVSGKADFGFTARYVNGVLQPVGNKWASMNFNSANLDFIASTYQSMVILNSKIILRGTGSLNGASGYSVLISARDGGTSGTSYIRYQIKNNAGVVVYDTQPNAADTADPTTPLQKGKIQIH